jgi:hypothetical protein
VVREVKDEGYKIFSIGLNLKNGGIQEKRLSDMAEGRTADIPQAYVNVHSNGIHVLE